MLTAWDKTKSKPGASKKGKRKADFKGQIHRCIKQASTARTERELNEATNHLRQILNDPTLTEKDLLGTISEGFSPFYNALFLPFTDDKQNPIWAGQISNALWEILFNTLKQRFPRKIPQALMTIAHGGFTLLHAATATSDSNVDKILALLKESDVQKDLQANLTTLSFNGFSILNQAIISLSPHRVKKITSFLQEPQNAEALRKNLLNVTKDNFMVLSDAAAHGNEEIFDEVLTLLRLKGNEKILQENLLNRNAAGFMLLQHALLSKNAAIIRKVIALLEEEQNKEALMQNLRNLSNNDDRPTLAFALATKNSAVINDVLALLKKHDADTLQAQIKVLNDGILLGAIAHKDIPNLESVIRILKMNKDRAKANIIAKSSGWNSCLYHAFISLNMQLITLVEQFIQDVYGEEAPNIKMKLMLLNKDNLLLSHAAASNDFQMFHEMLTRLKTPGWEIALQRNLVAQTENGYMPLQRVLIMENVLISQSMISLLSEPQHQSALIANLKHKTKDGSMVLWHATLTRNVEVINSVVALLKTHGALEENLRSLNPLTLFSAILSKDKTRLKTIINLLKMDKQTAKAHIKAIGSDMTNCLYQAVATDDMEVVTLLDDLIKETCEKDYVEVKKDLLKQCPLKELNKLLEKNYQTRAYVQEIRDKMTQEEYRRRQDGMRTRP